MNCSFLSETDRVIRQGLAQNRILPIRMPPCICPNPGRILKDAGIMFGSKIPLFQNVHLPTDWRIVPTEVGIWWDLLDERERRRASVKYKCNDEPFAFDAELELHTRYHYCPDYGQQQSENVATVLVMDSGNVIYATAPVHLPPKKTEGYEDFAWYEAARRADKVAIAWLYSHFPDWRNPSAYWN